MHNWAVVVTEVSVILAWYDRSKFAVLPNTFPTDMHYTPWAIKKRATFIFMITLANVDRFQ